MYKFKDRGNVKLKMLKVLHRRFTQKYVLYMYSFVQSIMLGY